MSALKEVFDALKAKADQSKTVVQMNGARDACSFYNTNFSSPVSDSRVAGSLDSFCSSNTEDVRNYEPCPRTPFSEDTLKCAKKDNSVVGTLHPDSIQIGVSFYEHRCSRSRASFDSYNHSSYSYNDSFKISKIGDGFKVVAHKARYYEDRFPAKRSSKEITFDSLPALLDYFEPLFQSTKPDWVIKKLAEEKPKTPELSVPKRQPA